MINVGAENVNYYESFSPLMISQKEIYKSRVRLID